MAEPGRGRGVAETVPDAADPRLRSRTLAVPFETVWQAAGRLAAGGLRRWSLDSSDDQAGVIVATARGLGKTEHQVTITIGLDQDAQTVVHVRVMAKGSGADLGRAARRLRRFMTALDKALARAAKRPPAGRGV
jgi:hypothetical protein